MSRKGILWTVILVVVVLDTWLVVRWLTPTPPPRISAALRRHLRKAEDKLAAEARTPGLGRPGPPPCLVVPAPAGVGPRAASPPKNPIRDCLQLAPGGPPVNAVELNLRTDGILFVQTDMYLPGNPPIAFTRVVQHQIRWNRRFQIYLQDEYDIFPFGHRFPFSYQKLELPDRRSLLFQRISKGTGYADAIFEHKIHGPVFYRALAGWNGNGWDMDLAGGETLVFPNSYNSWRPPQGALVGLIEPSGAALTLKRARNGNLQNVRSRDGRWMKLGYRGPSIVSLKDNAGQKASYSYDGKHLLSSSTNAAGETLSYSYNKKGSLTEVWDVTTNKAVLQAHYGAVGVLTSLSVEGVPAFRFSYGIDSTGSYLKVGVKEKGVGDWTVLMGPCTGTACTYRILSR